MIITSVQRIDRATTYNDDTFSVVKLWVGKDDSAVVSLFFAPGQGEAVAEAINAAIEAGRK